MLRLHDLKQINEYEWEIPRNYRKGMNVPVRLFTTRKLLEKVIEDKSLEQAVHAAMLPELVGYVLVMPDMHQGYGFPIGGVAASRYPQGVISPGAIGYDINCGVRLLASQVTFEQAENLLDELADALNRTCPSGLGGTGAFTLSETELDRVCLEGAGWAKKNGFASEADLRRTEEQGCIEGALPAKVSARAKSRGRSQLGSLGSGNHFIEVDRVEQVFDAGAAQVMGLAEGCLVVQIHCGSRGFGHQICDDYVDAFQSAVHKYKIDLPDRELMCAPLTSPEGQAYLGAMRSAANFAFANRQILAHNARRAFEETFAGKLRRGWQLHQVYDICHNIAKLETHTVEGETVQVCVHRKGATRAFGPGSAELPEEYRSTGQPVLVPGSMGTGSWVLAGTEQSMQQSFGSCCHGAGRVMSRAKAKHEVRGEQLRRELEAGGVHIRAGSMAGLAEEAPAAYKDVDDVVQTVTGAKIARKVARLAPVAVIKG